MAAVGVGVGGKFMAHRGSVKKLPNATDILSGKAVELDKNLNTAEKYSLVVNICFELKRTHDKDHDKEKGAYVKAASHALDFMMSKLDSEFVVLGAVLICNHYDLRLDEAGRFNEFIREYGKHIMRGYKKS